MQIRLDNYERCYPKRLKRWFQADVNYSSYNKFIPKMERAVVGNIPIEIIKMFPKSVRGEKIKLFQQILSDTAITLRQAYDEVSRLGNFSFYDENFRPSKSIKSVAERGEQYINSALQECFGENFMRAKIKYAGFGSFANVFQLSFYDAAGKKIMRDKAFKVYNRLVEGDPRYYSSHNNYAEANFWTFLKRIAGHDLGKTQFTKHYISDLHSGYCMTDFLDYGIPKTTSPLPIYTLFKFKPPKDRVCNETLMGKIYDGGGYEKGKDFVTDKVLIRHLKRLFYARGKEVR